MAMTVHLKLKANGDDILGESTVTTLDREDTIECFSFDYGVQSASEAFSGIASGGLTHEPIRIVKRIDKATPLLILTLLIYQMNCLC